MLNRSAPRTDKTLGQRQICKRHAALEQLPQATKNVPVELQAAVENARAAADTDRDHLPGIHPHIGTNPTIMEDRNRVALGRCDG